MRYSALVVVVWLLAGCGDALNTAGGGDFAGQTYAAVEVTRDGSAEPVVPGTSLTLTFDADGITASAGCNQMVSGGGVIDGVLQADTLATTQMACDPAIMEQEAWWAQFLTSAPTVEVGEQEMSLTSGTTRVQMTAAPIVAGLPLTGITWTLDTLIDQDTASSVPAAAGVSTVVFTDKSMTVVVSDCRNNQLTVSLSQTAATFDATPFANSACTGDAASVDTFVMTVFGTGRVDYQIDGDRLTITGSDGHALGYRGA